MKALFSTKHKLFFCCIFHRNPFYSVFNFKWITTSVIISNCKITTQHFTNFWFSFTESENGKIENNVVKLEMLEKSLQLTTTDYL